MRFVWDERKNIANIRNHGIDFADAISLFDCPMLTCLDRRYDYTEERWVGIGIMKGMFAVIAYTEDDDTETIRIISVRKATRNEIKRFKDEIAR